MKDRLENIEILFEHYGQQCICRLGDVWRWVEGGSCRFLFLHFLGLEIGSRLGLDIFQLLHDSLRLEFWRYERQRADTNVSGGRGGVAALIQNVG